MNQAALEALRDSNTAPAIAGFVFGTNLGLTTVNDKVPVPIYSLDCSLPDGADLEIYNDGYDLIGVLCFCRHLGDVDLPALTEWQFAAYLTEINVGEYGQPFRFRFDYAVIDLPHLQDYVDNFRATAAIWGGFSHDPQLVTVKRTVTELVCQRGIRYPTLYHQQQSLRAVLAAHPFDRFLKLYHQLELLFDWVVVRRIQALGNDLVGIAQMMSRYSAGDLPSLTELLREYCAQPGELWEFLRRSIQPAYLPTVITVFQDYGKSGNPVKDNNWARLLATFGRGNYNLAHAKAEKLAQQQDVLDRFVKDLAAYWLFRIRCCVAHNRIGEYIMTDADQAFVVEFGEPLLKEVLRQVLSNPNLPV